MTTNEIRYCPPEKYKQYPAVFVNLSKNKCVLEFISWKVEPISQ